MSENDYDGGYYAIKGFIYQFDTTLIKILDNPSAEIRFEHTQDIDYKNYVIQVKHKETQDFQPSKVRKPIKQLLDEFKREPGKEYRLFCYFRNRAPEQVPLDVDELDTILGPEARSYDVSHKRRFVEHFRLEFSSDYESQFSVVIDRLRDAFQLSGRDEAILYHSILHSHLLRLAASSKDSRRIKKSDLDSMVKDAETKVFYRSYAKYLSQGKYENLIAKKYFAINGVNINNFERLLVIDVDDDIAQSELLMIINSIHRKFYREGKSPPPYICLRTRNPQLIRDVKRELISIGTQFADGTCFDGDIFRLDKLVKHPTYRDNIVVKFVDEKRIPDLLSKVGIHEVYQFFIENPITLQGKFKNVDIQVVNTNQVRNLLGR